MKDRNAQELFQRFEQNWPIEKGYYIWGTGNTALRFIPFLGNSLKILGFLDNDSGKWGTTFLGYPVYPPNEVLNHRPNEKIIVASLAYRDIVPDLTSRGLQENIDFCDSRFFVGICGWLWKKKIYMRRTDLSITSYCNLRCKHCNMLMPYYKQHQHYKKENVLSDVEAYFRWVDYVENLNILGGEPFLHPDLFEITSEIVKRYREHIGELEFFTNGIIIPKEDMLLLMRDAGIMVYIGDYRQGIPAIRPKVDEFVRTLEKYQIRYQMPESDVWVDFNHPETDRSDWDTTQLEEIREKCGQPFRGVHDKKFYFCHLNASAALSGQYSEEPGDFFDLSGDPFERGGELVAFDLICAPKGYVSYCRHCGGCSPMNQQEVPIAEQLPLGYTGRP